MTETRTSVRFSEYRNPCGRAVKRRSKGARRKDREAGCREATVGAMQLASANRISVARESLQSARLNVSLTSRAQTVERLALANSLHYNATTNLQTIPGGVPQREYGDIRQHL